MLKISLKAHNGQYLTADADENNTIRANRIGVGTWEVFTLINHNRTDDTLQHGDSVSLQTSWGKFVVAEAGGGREVLANRSIARSWETFIIEKVAGSGEITYADRVTLRTSNGQYLVAEGGGGHEVLANRIGIGMWETFTLETWNSTLVRLKSYNGQYLVAENGGGRELRADRIRPVTWETFVLVNRSGRRDGFVHGDLVSLQVWDGHFVTTEASGRRQVKADQNRAAMLEAFIIEKVGEPGEITDGDEVALRASNGQYLVAEGGGGREVLADRDRVGEWETFTLELAKRNPITFALTPSAPVQSGHPLVTTPIGITGARPILTLLIEYSDMPAPIDDTLTMEHIQEMMFGSGRSVKRWIEINSHSTATISNAGIYGPIRVAHPFSYYGEQTDSVAAFWTDVLNAAERAGAPLRMLDVNADGTITTNEMHPVVLDFSDCGSPNCGSQRGTTITTIGGVSYSGSVIGVGLYLRGGPIQGAAQLDNQFSTLVHELGHGLYNLPDRYSYRASPRGDVIANRDGAGEWERFRIEKIGGVDQLRHNDQVALRTHYGKYVVAEGGGGGYINADRDESREWETFVIEKIDHSGDIHHGDTIALRASNGQYLVAEDGGGREVLANRNRARTWEIFTIDKVEGSGGILSGDLVTFRVRNGQYIVAEADQRTTDRTVLEQGYFWAGACGAGQGGGFDIMDDNCRHIIMSVYDRIKLGWITPKVLTPENRGCYTIRPSFDVAEALILWDPLYPQEWYVLENRQFRTEFDEVPSSGLIISWVNEGRTHNPAVISAAAPTAIPDPLIANPTLDSLGKFKRQHPNAAFISGQPTLPRGDGTPSRFSLSFHSMPTDLLSFCIR